MNTYLFTFGAGHLKEVETIINPMSVLLSVEARTEEAARSIVMQSFIGNKFCTSYPSEMAGRMINDYGMHLYKLYELETIRDAQARRVCAGSKLRSSENLTASRLDLYEYLCAEESAMNAAENMPAICDGLLGFVWYMTDKQAECRLERCMQG